MPVSSRNILAKITGTQNIDDLYSPFGELKTTSTYRLVGTAFYNAIKDPNFWSEAVTGSGAVSQAGVVSLATGATANSTVKYTSVRLARKPPGAIGQFMSGARFTTAGTVKPLTATLILPVRMENINSGGLASNIAFDIRYACILRVGELETERAYKYIGTNDTHILKYGAGHLHNIIVTDNAGTLTVYNSTAATVGKEIAVIDETKTIGTLSFDIPFDAGFTVVSGGGAKCTVAYE